MNDLETTENFLKKNVLDEEIMDLPFDDFIVKSYNALGSESYGNVWVRRLMKDSNFIRRVMSSEDKGDCVFYNQKERRNIYFEMKISYLNNNKNPKYRLPNLRFYQEFDYFLFCFVDRINRKYGIYMIKKSDLENCRFLKFTPMNGTKDINSENKKVAMSASISPLEMEWLFGDYNQLDGTSYDILLKYFEDRKISFNFTGENMSERVSVSVSEKIVRKKSDKFKFVINNNIEISGRTNRETWKKFVEHIGPKNICGIIYPSILSRIGDEYRSIHVGGGYFLNEKISIRETISCINKINESNLNLRISILKTKTNEKIQ